MIHPEVQALIASTNGKHYLDRVQKLNTYPTYNLPVPEAPQDSIMLEIGSGWGRWLVAAASKNYIPVGIDIHHHFCETCRHVLDAHHKSGYLVNADLEYLPFKAGVFDLLWSFSVIQHVHLKKLQSCIAGMSKIIHNHGSIKLEFPNKNGIHNRVYLKEMEKTRDDIESLDVRYYSLQEYNKLFEIFFSKIKIENHSFLGIGILKDDLKYVSFKNKMVVLASLLGSAAAKIMPALTKFSDSIYITGKNAICKNTNAVNDFLQKHKTNPRDNLNIVSLLQCPVSGLPLILSEDRCRLIAGNLWYPVKNNIPVLIPRQASHI